MAPPVQCTPGDVLRVQRTAVNLQLSGQRFLTMPNGPTPHDAAESRSVLLTRSKRSHDQHI